MSAPAFTPGPWSLTSMGGQTLVHVFDERIARVFTRNGVANARLIAAAPELLDALNTLFDGEYIRDGLPQHIRAKVVAALAKARGQ